MSIRPRIRDLAPYDFDPHPAGAKLDQNELPSDLPEALREEFLSRLRDVPLNRYPDLQARELRARLARLHDWPEEGVVVTPGSNVLIQSLVIAAGIGQTVIAPAPSFGVYSLQARMLGADLIEVPLGPDFSLSTGEMMQAMRRGRGVLFVANPAAPTGNLHRRGQLERLIEAGDGNWTVVIDEAYHQFAGSDFADLARRQGVVSLRTLSKAFGLAGARVGYALTNPDLATELRKTVNPFAVSGLQQAAALTMLEHHDLVLRHVAEVVAERDRLQDALRQLAGVRAFPSVTNFILLRLNDAGGVHRELLRREVVVRRQSGALSNYLRVTVGTRQENERFLTALREALQEVGHEQIG